MAVTPVSIEHVAPRGASFKLADGTDVPISPVTIGEYPKLLGHVRSVVDSLVLAPEGCFERLEKKEPAADDLVFLANLLVDHAESVLSAMSIAARLPRDRVDALLPDEGLELLVLLLEVNADFFGRALPRLQQLWARGGAALPKKTSSTGQTASSS